MTNIRKTLNEYAGPIVVVVAAIYAVFAMSIFSDLGRDFSHMLFPTDAFVGGDWAAIYPEGTRATSFVGWILLVAIPYMILKPIVGVSVAFNFAGLVAVPLLVGGMRYACRSLYPGKSDAWSWWMAAAALLLPTTVSGWTEFHHPQDVAATGLMLFGVGLAAKNKWVAAAVLFGFGSLTRHWVVLAGLAVSPLAKRKLLFFAGVAAAVVGVGVLPFYFYGNGGFPDVVSPPLVFYSMGQTLLGQIVSKTEFSFYRFLPVAAAVVIAVVAAIKKMDGKQYVVPLAMLALVSRMIFEVASYTYYWMPVTALMLLLTSRKVGLWVTAVFSFALLPIGMFRGTPQGDQITSVGFLAAGMVAVVIVWMLFDPDEITRNESSPRDSFVVSKRKWLCAASASVVIVLLGVGVSDIRIPNEPRFNEVVLPALKEVAEGAPRIQTEEEKPGVVEGE